MTVLFDTNVLIDYMNGSAKAKSAINAVASDSACISRITWIEIMGGFDHSDQALLAKNAVTLALFDIIEISAEVSALAARILSERLMDRRAKNQNEPKFRPPDAIIHATALLHADQLITSNGADFKDVHCHKNILVKSPL